MGPTLQSFLQKNLLVLLVRSGKRRSRDFHGNGCLWLWNTSDGTLKVTRKRKQEGEKGHGRKEEKRSRDGLETFRSMA